jgi:phospholipase/carboxylesterase
VAVGYSNGANIAAATMLLYPDTFGAAILFRAQATVDSPGGDSLGGTPVLLASGTRDPIISRTESLRLAKQLTDAGAIVTHEWVERGHELTSDDARSASDWLGNLGSARDSG